MRLIDRLIEAKRKSVDRFSKSKSFFVVLDDVFLDDNYKYLKLMDLPQNKMSIFGGIILRLIAVAENQFSRSDAVGRKELYNQKHPQRGRRERLNRR